MATPISNMTVTWNNAGTTYNAIKMNVDDNASNANSLLMDLQVGGNTKLSITKAGLIYGTGGYYVGLGGGLQSWFANINAVGTVGFGPAFTSDTILTRDNAANTLGQRNATNPQTFNVYNTYANSTNYERGRVAWESNLFTIGAQYAGTGQARPTYLTSSGPSAAAFVRIGTDGGGGRIWFTPNNLSAWAIETTGHFLAQVDNTFDIGASGATRPRYLHLGGGSLTGSQADSSITISPTWNTTGTPTAILLNVTDTASNANSLLMDLGTGGGTFASKFSVAKSGFITFAGHRMYSDATAICFTNSSNVTTLISRTDYTLVPQAAFIGWGNLTSFASDLSLYRDNAANTLGQRNATNAQTFNIYNTYTTTTNYERGFLKWTTNILAIGTEKGSGGGTARDLAFQTDGTTRLTIASGGGVTVQAGFALTCEYLYGPSTRLVLGNNANQLVTVGGFTSSFPALKRVGANLQTVAADDTATAGLIVGNQALATTATDGFLYVPTCAGTPTGTPTARTGTVPIVVDTTNNKLYFYSGAAWRDAGP